MSDCDPVKRLARTLDLFHRYRDEARRCKDAGAHLAGCVLLASAMEAALLAMVQCFPADVSRIAGRRRSRELSRPSSEWSLSQLQLVARKLNWLPSASNARDRLDPDKAQIGDYVEVVRAIRNLIHPSIYLRECPDKTIGESHLDLSFEVLEKSCARLSEALEKARAGI